MMGILIIVVVFVILFFFKENKGLGRDISLNKSTPMEILKERYAKGEITKEEFDDIKKDL
ncbi:SHOCT domain-containing protein [Haliovirga abyssi]|nr:SHOCT domain-containing protein [Haliovirga abyssi]